MSVFKKIYLLAALAVFTIAPSMHVAAQHTTDSHPEWSKPYKPFRIVGNVYYVGTYDLACYLITTPKGHVLINTGLETTVNQLQNNVKALGFKFTDIKIILISQAHADHAGGLAAIAKLTGAKVMIDAQDAPVIADGGNSDYLYGGGGRSSLFTAVKVDSLLQDRDIIALGGTSIELLHHPGHTKGSCSYMLTVKDEVKSYKLLIANIPYMLPEVKLPGMPSYPNVGNDFVNTYTAMKNLKFDLWVAAHASQFQLHDKRRDGAGYNPSLFADKKRFYERIGDMEQIYREKSVGGK